MNAEVCRDMDEESSGPAQEHQDSTLTSRHSFPPSITGIAPSHDVDFVDLLGFIPGHLEDRRWGGEQADHGGKSLLRSIESSAFFFEVL